ncbi:MAG TPA: HEPN domain-containing protein [Polyangiaceae bacterium]|nr:HEPN domain-containing protein [Polyangiaceae bacterium]
MTDDARKRSIAAELARGKDALESAAILVQAGKYADAVSRAYYGAMHHVRALLPTEGTEPATHQGLQRLLSRDFVRAGRVDAETARAFSALEKFRQDADYTSEIVFTADAAARDVESANHIAETVRRILFDGTWLD